MSHLPWRLYQGDEVKEVTLMCEALLLDFEMMQIFLRLADF